MLTGTEHVPLNLATIKSIYRLKRDSAVLKAWVCK